MNSQPAGAHVPGGTRLALRDAILIALKDGQDHPRSAVRASVEVPDGPARTPEERTERQAQFARAVAALQAEGRITVSGGRQDGTGPEAVLRLVPPAADDRFAIDPALRDLLPPPSAGKVALLERQVLAEGCRDALVTWEHQGRTYLVDGHTRLAICRRHGRPYDLIALDKPDREAVLDWMCHWFGSRHLSTSSPVGIAGPAGKGTSGLGSLGHSGSGQEG